MVIGVVLVIELGVIVGGWHFAPEAMAQIAQAVPDGVSNTHALGNIVYTDYIYLFQAAGIVLLIAMIGAIVLTHRTRTGVHKQRIIDQVGRGPGDTLEIRKVEIGKGI